jgi:Universal stress protein family
MGRWKQIVVGVDGSPASRTALEWASEEAVRHGTELVVLTAWLPTPPPLAGTSSTLPTHGAIDARETAKELLMETIRDVLGEDPRSSFTLRSRRATQRNCSSTSPRTPMCSWWALAATAGSPGCSWDR